jgi:hypothetical protein
MPLAFYTAKKMKKIFPELFLTFRKMDGLDSDFGAEMSPIVV